MAHYEILAKRNRYNDGWTSENENFYLIIPQLGNKYFGIGGADKGREVYIFGRCTVIDNHGGTGADVKRQGSITVQLGDTIKFTDRTFRVEDSGDHYNAGLVELK